MNAKIAEQRIFEIVLKKLLDEVEIDLGMLYDTSIEKIVNHKIDNVGHAASYITSNLMQWSPIEEEDEE